MELRRTHQPPDHRGRMLLLALCFVTLAVVCVSVFAMWPQIGSLGLSATTTGTPFVDRVTVAPGSAAQRAGLRTGDVLDIGRLTPDARVRLQRAPRVGEPVPLLVTRTGEPDTVISVVATEQAAVPWTRWLKLAGVVWTILFCAILAWYRSGDPEVRLLVLAVLGVFAMTSPLAATNWITPWAGLDLCVSIVSSAIMWGGISLFVAYAMRFAAPPSRLRRTLAIATYVSAAVAVGFTLVGAIQLWGGSADPFLPAFRTGFARFLDASLPMLLAVCCLFATIREAHGAERSRVAWASMALAPLLLAAIFVSGVSSFNLGVPPAVTTIVFAFTGFIAPVVLSYSLLNGRLLDIGFIVNRAVVFSVVSFVLVGVFVLVEWLLTDWLRDANHIENILVAGVLALVLGVSMRLVHNKVDEVVDAMLFRKRHLDERAMNDFAREAPYITDRTVLLQRTVDVVEEHVEAEFAAVLLDDFQGHFGSIDENDPAVLRLRATHQMLDLRTVKTGIDGELAFPMVARGRLLGILVVGPQHSGETYAPDEIACVTTIGQSVGSALDLLAMRGDDSLHPVVEAISKLDTKVAALPTEIIEHLRPLPRDPAAN